MASHSRAPRRTWQRRIGAAVAILGLSAGVALADQVIPDDWITVGSICVGLDCFDGEAFGTDTARLKENNLRIVFDDTSATGPARDWRLRANSARNGGPSQLSVDDLSGSPIDPDGLDITSDATATRAVVLGDFDRDFDLDLVTGNSGQPNRLYLNAATFDPFEGVTGADVTADAHATTALAAADVNGDFFLDLIVGNDGQTNRLYLNSRTTADPFGGVTGTDITADVHATTAIAVGRVNNDALPDVVAGNRGQANRLYVNAGGGTPFPGGSGSDITADAHETTAVALGDVDGDGDLDLVVGNRGQANRVYLNDGDAAPFDSAAGSDIGASPRNTAAVALADVDGDGDLDVVEANDGQPARLYANNGTAAPFAGVTGTDIGTDAFAATGLLVKDVTAVGAPDVLVVNDGAPGRLFVNNGSMTPFAGVAGIDFTGDAPAATSVATDGPDGTGTGTLSLVDLVVGTDAAPLQQPNRLYHVELEGGSSPFAIVADAPNDSLRVDAAGRVGAGAPPDPAKRLDVTGDLKVRGDVLVTGGMKAGIVPVDAFGRRGRTATVTFETPILVDYAVTLSVVTSRVGPKFQPTLLSRGPEGFTFTIRGRPRHLVEVHWIAYPVGGG